MWLNSLSKKLNLVREEFRSAKNSTRKEIEVFEKTNGREAARLAAQVSFNKITNKATELK